jgi:hypothetical protein
MDKFFYLFLGERTLTNETDKKSCWKSNGHHRSATKAEHLLLFQKQHDPAAHVRTCQFFEANPAIKEQILRAATLYKE